MPGVKRRYYAIGGIALLIAALLVFWDWDWFIPIVQSQASAASGRRITIQHLHVQLMRRPIITAEGVVVANPEGFPAGPPFASVAQVQVQIDVSAYLHNRSILLPLVALDRPEIEARVLPDGTNNWTFGETGTAKGTGFQPQIGDLRIADGHAHVVVSKVKSDFGLDFATRETGSVPDRQIVVDVNGTYADQPITGRFVGGALLSLRDNEHPYPVDLQLANGPTKITLVGTAQDPLAFAGADLKLHLTGPDLSLLYHLTGIPIPTTPSYSLTGQLDYADGQIKLQKFEGRVGSTDLQGDIGVAPRENRELVTANITSRRVDLADLGGFIGSTPGRVATPNQTPAQRTAVLRAEANPRLIPNIPINLPRLRSADVELHYKGGQIVGRSIPLDNVLVDLTIRNGKIDLHPISFGIGRGQMSGNIALDGSRDTVHARADIDFRQVDLARLMAATHTFAGSGVIGGKVVIEGDGNSLAALLGGGEGDVKIFMGHGGDVSALLVDLSGLEFGNALLSALGMPKRAMLNCLIADLALQHGVLITRTMLVDTSEANVTGSGSINLRDETLNYQIRTEPKHFSIGSLPAPIKIDGKLKSPSVGPDVAQLGARAGAAAGLGALLTPLGALLPTIQLGLGDDNYCATSLHAPPPTPQASPSRRAVPPRATNPTTRRRGR